MNNKRAARGGAKLWPMAFQHDICTNIKKYQKNKMPGIEGDAFFLGQGGGGARPKFYGAGFEACLEKENAEKDGL